MIPCKFADELAPLDSLPPGNDDSTLKKDLHEENFQVYSNPLFEFDDNFKSSNVNPLFEEKDKDVEIKSFSFPTLTSPEESELILEEIEEKDSIPPGVNLNLPPTFEFSSSNPTSLTLTGEKDHSWKMSMFFSLVRFVWKMMKRNSIRKKIICLLATYLHKKPKPLSRPQAAQEEIKIEEDKVSSDVPINTIVMPIRITFDNPIDFNDNFSKPKDFKKDLTVTFDSTKSSIFPPPLLDSDSPFTAELSASITLNSLGNEDKVFQQEVIVNGDSVSTLTSASVGAEGPIPPKTAEQKLARKNEIKAKSSCMLAIPDEHILKFHAYKDAKTREWRRAESTVERRGGDDLKLKLQKFEESSKNLTKLINSQVSAKDKTGLGYDSHINESEVVHIVFSSRESDVGDSPVNDRFKTGEGFHAVPPPYTGNYMPPNTRLSLLGLE
ncbi:hypothetical protein Tco_0084139 [Tanacetum coccineum]